MMMSTKELAQAEYRNRKPGDPIDGIPLLYFDETGYSNGPAVMWINPWNGQPEAVCAFWWPTHPPEQTELIEHVWDELGQLFAASPEKSAAEIHPTMAAALAPFRPKL